MMLYAKESGEIYLRDSGREGVSQDSSKNGSICYQHARSPGRSIQRALLKEPPRK